LIIPNHEFISDEGDHVDGGYNRNLIPHSSLKISGPKNNPAGSFSPLVIDEF